MPGRSNRYSPRHLLLTPIQRQRWAEKHYGVFAEIAEEMGRSRNHVRQVFYGFRPSTSVSRALDRKMARLQDRAA